METADENLSKTVVAGEASESDDDDIQEQTAPVPTGASNSKVIVSGEASESEDEIDSASHALPPLNVNTSEVGDKGDITNPVPLSPTSPHVVEQKPKYNTLLNKKLRERNIALRRHLLDSVHHSYTAAGKDLHNITLQLLKTQMIVQDVSHNMRNITNDLFNLEDKVDIVTSCSILPNIVLPKDQVQST